MVLVCMYVLHSTCIVCMCKYVNVIVDSSALDSTYQCHEKAELLLLNAKSDSEQFCHHYHSPLMT